MMKDLYRSLEGYVPELLQAIAGAWRIALPKDELIRMVKRLGDAMLVPNAVETVMNELTPNACKALAYLVAEGGVSPARALSIRHGTLRRFGPARLRREKPWLAPESPLEELYYKGLVYRAYGQVGDYYGDLILIPHQLLESLPPLAFRSMVEDTESYTLPKLILAAGQSLMEDLVAEIVCLRHQPIRLGLEAELPETLLQRLDLGSRLLGPSDPARLQLLWRSLERLDMVNREGNQWRLTLEARQWLRQQDAAQWLATYSAWRDDEIWDELLHLPSIICDPARWENNPAESRARFCSILADYPAEEWYDLDSLIGAFKDHHPDYLRPDGDMDSWFIRDAETGDYLRGFEAWDDIEGALARHFMTGPLHHLGIVDLGYEKEALQPVAFRLTVAGKQLLSREMPVLTGEPTHDPSASIDEELAISISLRDTRYLRYQLERLAEWQGQDNQWAVYRLTDDSVWQSQNAGIQMEQIESFLRRITSDNLPDAVMQRLHTWGSYVGRASLRQAILLETVDEATLQQIQQMPQIAPLLGAKVGPTLCLVEEEDMEALVQALKQVNIWPRIHS